jgi:hypothetical protein
MGLIGSLFSLPYVVLFFAMWILSSLSRPLFYASLVCLALNPVAAKKKITLFITTFRYMAFCNDKKWKEPEPATFSVVNKVETKTVIFVRHGEST